MNRIKLFESFLQNKDKEKQVRDIANDLEEKRRNMVELVKPDIIHFMSEFNLSEFNIQSMFPDDYIYDGMVTITHISKSGWDELTVSGKIEDEYGKKDIDDYTFDALSSDSIIEIYETINDIELEDMIIFIKNEFDKDVSDLIIKFFDKIDFDKEIDLQWNNGSFLENLNTELSTNKLQEMLILNKPDYLAQLIIDNDIKINKEIAKKYGKEIGTLVDSKELGLL